MALFTVAVRSNRQLGLALRMAMAPTIPAKLTPSDTGTRAAGIKPAHSMSRSHLVAARAPSMPGS